jgi:hypothetical protein
MATKKKKASEDLNETGETPAAEDLHEDGLPEEPIVMDPQPIQEMPKKLDQPKEEKIDETANVPKVPKECFDEAMPEEQRVDIFLSDEWDRKPKEWQEENDDKAGYMNERENRLRAVHAIKQ